MRLPSFRSGVSRRQRAFVRLTRAAGAELDDVGKSALRRPGFFGKPFLALVQSVLRGPSAWSVGERELFAAVVSRTNSCEFCLDTHGAIAARELGRGVLTRLDEAQCGPRATATAHLLDALTRDPESFSHADLEPARAAGVDDEALAEAFYVAFVFNVINRVADALEFEHGSDAARRRGAEVLRRQGYRLPAFLLR